MKSFTRSALTLVASLVLMFANALVVNPALANLKSDMQSDAYPADRAIAHAIAKYGSIHVHGVFEPNSDKYVKHPERFVAAKDWSAETILLPFCCLSVQETKTTFV